MVENPVPENPVKKMIDPYVGTGHLGGVKVGDLLTYEISYKNYKAEATDVVIKDKLDVNVEFVSATDGGVYQNGTVTWVLKNVPAGQKGAIRIIVKVLDSVLPSKGGPGKVTNGGIETSLRVGNDDEYELDIVDNPVLEDEPEIPVQPHKKEIAPYSGNGKLGEVKVGDEITYEISYKNYKSKATDIVITDKLDANVEYISSSDNGRYINGAVQWVLAGVPAGQEGKVTLTVKVLEGALSSKKGPGKVVNGGDTATVKIGNDPEYTLELVENPVLDSKKTDPPKDEVKKDTPKKTGDSSPLIPVAIAMVSSIIGMIIVYSKKKKK